MVEPRALEVPRGLGWGPHGRSGGGGSFATGCRGVHVGPNTENEWGEGVVLLGAFRGAGRRSDGLRACLHDPGQAMVVGLSFNRKGFMPYV